MTQPIAPKFLSEIACARYAPIPGSVIVWLPTVMASDATTKNQPPDIDIIMFQISPGIENGTSSFQKRCHDVRWKPRDTSSRSRGTVRSDW